MKKLVHLLTAMAAFAFCSTSNADITSAAWDTANPNTLTCTYWHWDPATSTLDMDGVQHGSVAQMNGVVQTTDALDPTLTLGNSVNNDSGITWLGYQVNVIMTVPFTFTVPGPTVGNPSANDWYVASVSAPTLQVSGPHTGSYEGSLFFNSGTPIGTGGELDYLYSVHFEGSTSYAFTQEAFAYMTYIPEPGALALVGMGGLMLVFRLRRNPRA